MFSGNDLAGMYTKPLIVLFLIGTLVGSIVSGILVWIF